MGLGAVYTEAGDPADVVKLIDVAEPPDPGPGQVLVRVTLFPIHWGDLQVIQLSSPKGWVGAGVEATGVVEKVGPGVHHVTPGARVSVFPQPGAWAERFTADAQFVVPVPDSVSDEVAAQMLVNPLTVLMLRREAGEHFTTGYDGVVLNNAAGRGGPPCHRGFQQPPHRHGQSGPESRDRAAATRALSRGARGGDRRSRLGRCGA
jgi:NADPH:quinone reductase-like Zn-dependent oxidoreductase